MWCGYKRTISIKQVTPIIHFQWNEEGACIRGSEFKPKFDRFILEHKKEYENKLNAIIDDSCYCDKENGALNYKIRISPSSNDKDVSDTIGRDIAKLKVDNNESVEWEKKKQEKKKIDKEHIGINGLYFGNMGKTEEEIIEKYKEAIKYRDDIKVTFVCTNEKLQKIIDGAFEDFIAITNFGTRQNKGFGSFVTESLTLEKEKEILNKLKIAFFYCKTKPDTDKLMLVDAIYSCMKGGKNNNKFYIESFIQKHYLDNKKSDKAFIKSQGLFEGDEEGNEEGNEENYAYVRALLGLADHIDFKDPQGKEKYDGDTTIRIGRVNVMSADSIDEKIERYKSPFTVKILEDSIFFIYEDTFELIKGKKFKFKGESEKSRRKTVIYGKESAPIFVPDTFDVNSFICKFVKYYNNEKEKYKNSKDYNEAAIIELEQ